MGVPKEQNNIFINPHYSFLEDYIHCLPSNFKDSGSVLQDGRNVVKYFQLDNCVINVKEFCTPRYFWSNIAYCTFRAPKAVRAYTNAEKLLSLGIDTPTPIAYSLLKTSRFHLSKSYFVSQQVSFEHNIRDFEGRELDASSIYLLSELGRFTARLHDLGIYHKDYGGGNILINYHDGKPQFSLIDINRMDFEPISMQRGCSNFDRLHFSEEQFEIVSKAYAQARGFSPEEVYSLVLKYRAALKSKRQLKNGKLKKIKRWLKL